MSNARIYSIVFFILNFFILSLQAEEQKNCKTRQELFNDFFETIPYKEICFNSICCINQPKPQAEIEKERHLFQPKDPKPLTPEEQAKSVRQRIQEKFIGKLPKQIDQLIARFENPQTDSESEDSVTNRLLLTGDTGTGKTHLIEVLIHALQVKSFSIPACRLDDKYCGEESRRIREVFANAKALNEPTIIFIEFIDILIG